MKRSLAFSIWVRLTGNWDVRVGDAVTYMGRKYRVTEVNVERDIINMED